MSSPSKSPETIRPLPTSFPLPYYAPETCLDEITILPSSSLRPDPPKYRFPPSVAPLDRYLSHLPPERLGLEKAARDGHKRVKNYAATNPDDPDVERTLYIGIRHDTFIGRKLQVEEMAWALVWTLSATRVAARACLSHMGAVPSDTSPSYVINYGPCTRADSILTLLSRDGDSIQCDGVVFVPVSSRKLSFAQRRELEDISWNVGVLDREHYTTQNWVTCVLAVAVARGILEEDDVRKAINEALNPDLEGEPFYTSFILRWC